MPDPDVTPAQLRLLNAVQTQISLHGYAPSVRELMVELDLTSTNAIQDALRIAERKGLITKEPLTSRSIRLTRKGLRAIGKPCCTCQGCSCACHRETPARGEATLESIVRSAQHGPAEGESPAEFVYRLQQAARQVQVPAVRA